jgi:integrase
MTLAAFLEQWLADVVWQRNRPSTHGYEFYVRKYIIPALGRHQIRKLTPQQVQHFLNEMHSRGLAPRTAQYIRAILRRALNQARRWELVSRNVATLADPPSGLAPEMRPLTIEDARRFLAAAHGHRHERLFAFLLGTGLRIGEALALRWSDVDMDDGVITIRHALERLNGRPWRLAAGAARHDLDFVFPTAVGTPGDQSNVYHQFKKAASVSRTSRQLPGPRSAALDGHLSTGRRSA